MIRRKKVIPPRREKQLEMSLLGEILANVNLSWAEACRGDNLDTQRTSVHSPACSESLYVAS